MHNYKTGDTNTMFFENLKVCDFVDQMSYYLTKPDSWYSRDAADIIAAER